MDVAITPKKNNLPFATGFFVVRNHNKKKQTKHKTTTNPPRFRPNIFPHTTPLPLKTTCPTPTPLGIPWRRRARPASKPSRWWHWWSLGEEDSIGVPGIAGKRPVFNGEKTKTADRKLTWRQWQITEYFAGKYHQDLVELSMANR